MTRTDYDKVVRRFLPRFASLLERAGGALQLVNELRRLTPDLTRAEAGRLVRLAYRLRESVARIPEGPGGRPQPKSSIPVVPQVRDPLIADCGYYYELEITITDPITGEETVRRITHVSNSRLSRDQLEEIGMSYVDDPDQSDRLSDFYRGAVGEPEIEVDVTAVYRDC
jgi:hypothetical protein